MRKGIVERVKSWKIEEYRLFNVCNIGRNIAIKIRNDNSSYRLISGFSILVFNSKHGTKRSNSFRESPLSMLALPVFHSHFATSISGVNCVTGNSPQVRPYVFPPDRNYHGLTRTKIQLVFSREEENCHGLQLPTPWLLNRWVIRSAIALLIKPWSVPIRRIWNWYI